MTRRSSSMPDDLRARTAERTRRNALRATQKANRRRAWPRWMGKAIRGVAVLVPLAGGVGAGVWGWYDGLHLRMLDRVGSSMVRASMEAGLVVREVMVEGRSETDPDALMRALDVVRGSPILVFDPDRARMEIERLPWVATATVERRLPDTVFIRLTERRPLALWQLDGRLALIDVDGVVLTERDLGRYSDFPILVGPDAPKHGQELIVLLQTEPMLHRRVEAAIRIGGRRWNLKLSNGIEVRLPETGLSEALRQLADLEEQHPLLERDVVAIDLRLPDRLIVQTSSTFVERNHLSEEKI